MISEVHVQYTIRFSTVARIRDLYHCANVNKTNNLLFMSDSGGIPVIDSDIMIVPVFSFMIVNDMY